MTGNTPSYRVILTRSTLNHLVHYQQLWSIYSHDRQVALCFHLRNLAQNQWRLRYSPWSWAIILFVWRLRHSFHRHDECSVRLAGGGEHICTTEWVHKISMNTIYRSPRVKTLEGISPWLNTSRITILIHHFLVFNETYIMCLELY